MGSCGSGGGVHHFVPLWLYGQRRLRGFYMRGISVLDEHSQNNIWAMLCHWYTNLIIVMFKELCSPMLESNMEFANYAIVS
jgi:hypothetical protein